MTQRQRALLAYIVGYREANDGISPTYAEMMDAIGSRSKSNIYRLVHGLVERGHLRSEGGSARRFVPVVNPEYVKGYEVGFADGYRIAQTEIRNVLSEVA